jgi:membrane-associated phospholipid phosphatase
MTSRSSAARAVCGAGILFALLALLWSFTFHTAVGVHANLAIIDRLNALPGQAHLVSLATALANLVTTPVCAAATAALVIVCISRKQPVVAVAIIGVVAVANETTELLKPLLSERLTIGSFQFTPGFPSGHVTAVTSLALCALLAVPRGPWRGLVAVAGAILTLAVACSVVLLGWHYPSDAVAGALVSGGWWFLGIAATRLVAPRLVAPRLGSAGREPPPLLAQRFTRVPERLLAAIRPAAEDEQ